MLATYNDLLLALEAEDLGEKIKEIGDSPLLVEHEVLHARYALLARKYGLDPGDLPLACLESGAVLLFSRSLFPWGGLPYPYEHAKLGILLAQVLDIEAQELVKKMGHFQLATLAHDGKAILPLFSQEKTVRQKELDAINHAFFETLKLHHDLPYQFVDHELGMVAKKSEKVTSLSLASGCKSGLGAYLVHDVGVINFGPQLSSVGDCAAFGLAGRGDKIHIKEVEDQFFLSFRCRLAAPSTRDTGFSALQDSGYSAVWMINEIEMDLSHINVKGRLEGLLSRYPSVSFVLFGKGKACKVAGSHKLSPRSLDRYQGPVQPVEFISEKASVQCLIEGDVSKMEIIPLAGDHSFWGADFLVAYFLSGKQISFTMRDTIVDSV